ncbi:MAG TPA: hypothetical protein VNO30_41635 [Kofleriaceae bacterium]|nr:hypothetical protein [Kofleriaceae bacterium]
MRLAFAAVAILLVSPAAAQHRERAAVVAIDLGAGAPTYLRTTAASQVEAGLAAAGYDVMPVAAASAQLTGELAKCRDGACVRRVGAALGVRSLVFVTLDGKDENTIVTLRVHDGRTGERDAEVREVCDLCGQAELAARLGIAASTVRAAASEARARREQQALSAASSAKTGPAAGAGAAPGAAPGGGATRSIVPGLGIGVTGALALAAGAYLVAIDGRGTCKRGDGPVYPEPGAVIWYPDPSNMDLFVCRDVYETKVMGIASAGVGAAALVAGALLVVRARRTDRTVEIAPGAGGATVKVTWPW